MATAIEGPRFYAVTTDVDDKVRLVKAKNRAQALRFVVPRHYAEVASEVTLQMAKSLKIEIEDATELPDGPA